MDEVGHPLEEQRFSEQEPGPPWCAGTRRASRKPNHSTGRQTAKPASGPDTPMSNSALRFGIGDRMRMKAPRVPTRLKSGNGMKKGSVASTP